MFDWIEWNPQRLQNPQVIAGLIVIVLGIMVLALSQILGNKIAVKFNLDEEKVGFYSKIAGFFVVVVGCIIAVTI